MAAADPMVLFPELLEYPFRWAASSVKELYEESVSRGSLQGKEGSKTMKGRKANECILRYLGFPVHLVSWEA